jgi:uncharacterized protein YndB with AHSA1/START domain
MSRALADVQAGTILASIEIEAAPEVVFDALVEPEQLMAWWGSDDTYRTSDWQVDLRPGGAWSARASSAHGEESSIVRGTYVEIDRPRLLVYTWQASWDGFAETLIRVELGASASGTRVKVTHTGFGERRESAAGHANGWCRVLEWLAEHAEVAALPTP